MHMMKIKFSLADMCQVNEEDDEAFQALQSAANKLVSNEVFI
jgi:hypothetical protein